MPRIDLSSLSVADLTKELARRENAQAKLAKRRDKLVRELAALNAKLGVEPAQPAKRRGRKPGRKAKAKRAAKAAKVVEAAAPKAAAVKAAAPKGRRGRRPKNTMTLPEVMAKVMSAEKAMGVKEIAAAAAAAGYKSKSKTFHTIIYQALKKENKKFLKSSRGRYVLAK